MRNQIPLLSRFGDIIVRGASSPQRLALGSAGYSLKSDGTDVVWKPTRETLAANRTYYCDWTNGSDSNAGLSAGAGNAFKTIQKAIDTCTGLDFNGFTVTIQLADGTYTSGAIIGAMTGLKDQTCLVIQGNNSTPSNVVISTTSADCFLVNGRGSCTVKDLQMQTTTSGRCLYATFYGRIDFGNVVFAACAQEHIRADNGAQITQLTSYSITGGATNHALSSSTGVVRIQNGTVTITGTPTFSTAFANAGNFSFLVGGATMSGSANGVRYLVALNSVMSVGGSSTYWPGSSAGSTATGGQYV